jgi:Fe-S cluster assembly protein SufD
MSAAAIDMALLERAVMALPADTLGAVRREALASFMDTGFPHPKLEDWKYTNLAPAIELSNVWLRDPGEVRDPAIDAALRETIGAITDGIDAHWLVLANGTIEEASLDRLSRTAAGRLETWSAARRGEAPDVFVGEPMSRFNAALLRDVLHIRVTAGCTIDKPIGLLMIDDARRETGVSQARMVIDLGEGARAQFIELQVSTGEHGHFSNGVTELVLAPGAQADYLRLQERGPVHFQVNRLTARLERGTVLNHAAIDLGGALVRNDVDVDIAGPGAAVSLQGLYLAHGRQHIDNHTRIDHRVGPAKRVVEFRGILIDRARCGWAG